MKRLYAFFFGLLLAISFSFGQNLIPKGENEVFDFVILPGKNEIFYQENQNFNFINLETNEVYRSMPVGIDDVAIRMVPVVEDSVILVGFSNGSLGLYDVVNEILINSFKELSGKVTALDYFPAKELIAAGTDKGELMFYDLKMNEIKFILSNLNYISDVGFSNDGELLLAGGQKNMYLVNTKVGFVVDKQQFIGRNWIRGIYLKPNEDIAFSCDDARNILKWKFSTTGFSGKAERILFGNSWLTDVDGVSGDHETLAYSSVTGVVEVITAFGNYKLKKQGMIYRVKLIEVSPMIKLAYAVKQKGIVILDAQDMSVNNKSYYNRIK